MTWAPQDDIIECDSWFSMGDTLFETGDEIPVESSVVYCNIEHITDFFEKCRWSDQKFVVISAYSDFGPAIQAENPVWRDLIKWFHMQDLANLGYQGIQIYGRCEPEKCSLDHKYSNKCWSFTHSTFADIPENVVKWFVVNPLFRLPDKIQPIPLGIQSKTANLILDAPELPREKLLYVNCQNYNLDRVRMKQWFAAHLGDAPWLTLRMECDRSLEEYIADLSSHKFIFCPYGNGVDTYRIWETLYLGAIPVVVDLPTYADWNDIPLVRINDLDELTEEFLENQWFDLRPPMRSFEMSEARLSYWKKEIENARQLLS